MRRCLLVLLLIPAARSAAAPLPDSSLASLRARSIGPANMSGRITSLAVYEAKPAIQYVGTASGGVWKTLNGGKTWTPLFDDQPTQIIGAVAVAASNPDVVFVGTGESNPRNSVSWGDGVYRSDDGGKTWQHVGLRNTQHIGKILIHPRNPLIVHVAALGRVWGPNPERGVFRTTDGGKSWQHVLALDADTGCIDLASHPATPDILFAAAYRVRRGPYAGGNPRFQFGPKAGLYRSRDGGKTWSRLTKGLPLAQFGRCGLAVSRVNPKVIFAVIQTAQTNTRQLPGQPARANNNPETGGIFRSDDGGDTWIKINDLVPRPFYFGQIRVDPRDESRLYVLGIPLYVSGDGGRTFRTEGQKMIHPDHHDLWIDPANSQNLVLGNDGGVYYSQNRGRNWRRALNLPVGQFYAVALDDRKPYRLHGGTQDNGTWAGPSRTSNPAGIVLADWRSILRGDGFQCVADRADPNVVFAEMQYGRVFRIPLRGGKAVPIQPRAPRGTPSYRFNWNTPLVGSPHDRRVLYVGGNHVFRTDNGGNTWQIISPDLTSGPPGPSNVSGHTLSTLAESPVQPGLLYAGSDDGRIHITRNGGKNWTDLSARLPGVPAARWITRIEPSPHRASVAWLALSRHRNDDQQTYLFRTDDFGATWRPMHRGLPPESPVHVVKLDPRNPDLVYAGTEHGLWLSIDGGANWQRIREGLPAVPVHDLAVHARDRELAIATHGRSFYIIDVAPLQELSAKARAEAAYLVTVRPGGRMDRKPEVGAEPPVFAAPNPPAGMGIYYHLKGKVGGPVRLEVRESGGRVLATLPGPAGPGLHRVQWDLRFRAPGGRPGLLVPSGDYSVVLIAGEHTRSRPLRVEAEE